MVGGVETRTVGEALESLQPMNQGVEPIGNAEFRQRLDHLQLRLQELNVDAIYLHAGSNLYYFTGLAWNPSERMVAALVPASGPISYVAPSFELDTLRDFWQIEAEILDWQEHESPYLLVRNWLRDRGLGRGRLLIDEVTPMSYVAELQRACDENSLESAGPVCCGFRSRKSAEEIRLIQTAHNMTLSVIRAAASILKPGIRTPEVVEFIEQGHRRVGAAGSTFCIVLFGQATSFPHGVKDPQVLAADDEVLIDTGCLVHHYHSDITRSFAFGSASESYRRMWELESASQQAAFAAAVPGQACEVCDNAARQVLQQAGLGPDYALPGLPHRTGHGCGLDIHESPNLVRGEKRPLERGMVFSVEPMIVVPGEFGVRLEDHFWMSDDGPSWFTQPATDFDNPLGIT